MNAVVNLVDTQKYNGEYPEQANIKLSNFLVHTNKVVKLRNSY